MSEKVVCIREVEERDLTALLRLEELCWKEHLRATAKTIKERVKLFKQGQFVLDVDGEVCGVLYTQRVNDLELLKQSNYQDNPALHVANGKYWQLLCINIDPKRVANGAFLIRQFVLEQAKRDELVSAVVAMTRCSAFTNFAKAAPKSKSFDDYIHYVHSKKDPTIFFHCQGLENPPLLE